MDTEEQSQNLDQFRKSLPIYTIRNKLLSEIQRNSCIILLGSLLSVNLFFMILIKEFLNFR